MLSSVVCGEKRQDPVVFAVVPSELLSPMAAGHVRLVIGLVHMYGTSTQQACSAHVRQQRTFANLYQLVATTAGRREEGLPVKATTCNLRSIFCTRCCSDVVFSFLSLSQISPDPPRLILFPASDGRVLWYNCQPSKEALACSSRSLPKLISDVVGAR